MSLKKAIVKFTKDNGEMVWDGTYIYWCVATNTWIRAIGLTW